MNALSRAKEITRLLENTRIGFATELEAQNDIAAFLTAAGMVVRREVRLSPTDKIDLMVDRVGVEVKVKGQRRAIYGQIERYAVHDEVEALVLVSSTSWPRDIGLINGKPLFIASLSRGWL